MKEFFKSCLHRFWLITLITLSVFMTGCASSDDKADSSGEAKQIQPLTPDELNDPQTVQSFLYAGFEGKLQEVTDYLNRGMDIDQTNISGQTLLMIVAYNGRTDLIKFCLQHGAELDKRDIAGRTPLMYASSGPFPETVKYLLRKGADPNAVDYEEKWTALMYAAAEGHMDVVRILLKKGADPELRDVDGDTAASFARKNGFNEVADFLESLSE